MPYVGRTPSAVPVTADDIPANSIDASKIVDGSIELAEIADNSITDAKLNSSKLDGIETGATNYIHPTTHATADIADNAITDAKLNSAKLNGIEASATADQTAGEILTALKTVDGSGSGLDADLLDGTQGSSFLRSDVSDTFTSLTGSSLFITSADAGIVLKDNSGSPTDQSVRIRQEAVNTGLPNGEGTGIVIEDATGGVQSDTTPALIVTGEIYAGNPSPASTNVVYHAGNIADAGAVMDSDTTTASMSFVVDEDAMTSNSATKLPTQQSVKAYVDSQIGAINVSTVSTTAPASPAAGDMWFDTTSGVTSMKVWSGSGWDQMSNKFTATGGTTSTYISGGIQYKAHTFTSSGTFTAEASGSVNVLIVAGGAGGGSGGGDGAESGGGGGAGGVVVETKSVTAGAYTITVGGGGAGGANSNGTSGNNSLMTSATTAIGGGGAGKQNSNGLSGGSGGGAGGIDDGDSATSGGSGTSGQGYAGGHSSNGSGDVGGGGGGASQAGTGFGSPNATPHGGDGIANNYKTGSNITYAGGGGGANNLGGEALSYTAGSGGAGGGGAGFAGSSGHGTNGSTNKGGGGGGGNGATSWHGGSGGSGIVVIRYAV